MNGKLKKLTDENAALRTEEACKVGRRNDEVQHQCIEDDLEHHRRHASQARKGRSKPLMRIAEVKKGDKKWPRKRRKTCNDNSKLEGRACDRKAQQHEMEDAFASLQGKKSTRIRELENLVDSLK